MKSMTKQITATSADDKTSISLESCRGMNIGTEIRWDT